MDAIGSILLKNCIVADAEKSTGAPQASRSSEAGEPSREVAGATRGCGCGECEAAGDRQTAITFYKKLIALTAKADAENKEAEEAKAFLASGQKPKVGTVG